MFIEGDFVKKILLFVILLFPVICFADNVSVKEVSIEDCSSSTEKYLSSFEGLSVNLDNTFVSKDDFVKYKIVVENKEDNKYLLSLDLPESEYIQYDVEGDLEEINPNSNLVFYIKATYKNEVKTSKLVNKVFEENKSFTVKLDREVIDKVIDNPFTVDQIIVISILFVVSLLLYFVFHKKKEAMMVGVAFIITPIISLGINFISYSINEDVLKVFINSNSIIKPKLNILRGTFDEDVQNFYGDRDDYAFYNDDYKYRISKIIFDDVINVPNDAIASWDVSEAEDESVVAYIVDNEYTDSTFPDDYLDLHIQANGKIQAPVDSSYLFSNFTFLSSIENHELFDMGLVTNCSYMFTTQLFEPPTAKEVYYDFTGWDMSNVTDMSGMFFDWSDFYCEKFTLVGLDSWDTSKVTNMSEMFYEVGLEAKTVDIGDLSNWNTSNVTNMSHMFHNTAREVTTLDLGDLSNWDTSNVTDMSYMFYWLGGNDVESINIGDISKWDTSKVTNMSYMFDHLKVLQLDLSGWNVDNVTNHTAFAISSWYNYKINSYINCIISPVWKN